MCRSISAAVNIIHDCDETFNYWEPLHYLLHESGFQTWEYSSAFALRSYLYLFFHALIALPVTLFFGNGTVNAFYTVRLALAVPSAASEASLLVAVAAALHKATQAPSLPSFLPITSLPTFPTSVNAFYAVRLALAVLSAASEASLPVAVTAALHKPTQASVLSSCPLPVTPLYSSPSQANAFYTVRLALAVLSAASEASLLVAVATALHKATSAGSASSSSSGTREDKEKGKEEEKEKAKRERAVPAGIGERVGVCGLLLLCFCSGNFLASTTFLPSTFSMYAITWATSLTIQGRPAAATAAAAAGVLLGWPFAGLAALPLVLHGMITGGFVKVVASGAITTVLVSVSGFEIIASGAAGVALCGPGSPAAGAARDDHWSLCEGGRVWCSHHSSRLSKWVPADRALSLCFDRLYYGPWTSSVFNLIRYNVFGGGDGVDSAALYLRNGLNNFSLALPLALILPLLLPPSLPSPDSLPPSLPPLSPLVPIQALSLCFDRLYYGQWTSSVFNLIRYNVFGGGDGAGSTLYGVEEPLFYLRNGLNNFTLALPLVLLPPSLPPLPPPVLQALSLRQQEQQHAVRSTLSVFRSPVDLLREREHRGGPLSLYYGQWTSSVLNLVRYNVFGGGDGAGLSLCFDRLYYGQWTSSVFNLIRYNVFGGGDGAGSTLYGVEGPLFYLRNGLNNFTLALPLALLLPLLLLIACFASSPFRGQGRGERGGVERGGKGFVGWKEVVTLLLLPVVIWVGFMSLQPHKEER
ncbi:unnamed protein product [Closterium sp. NIES-65]|nr:unnamed protein product [Closterium sp. NIES-65]